MWYVFKIQQSWLFIHDEEAWGPFSGSISCLRTSLFSVSQTLDISPGFTCLCPVLAVIKRWGWEAEMQGKFSAQLCLQHWRISGRLFCTGQKEGVVSRRNAAEVSGSGPVASGIHWLFLSAATYLLERTDMNCKDESLVTFVQQHLRWTPDSLQQGILEFVIH